MQERFMLLLLLLLFINCHPEEEELLEADFTGRNLTSETTHVASEANRFRVKNIEALRKSPLPNENRKEVTVLGYYKPDDGGGGVFAWNNESTEDDNGGTIIASDGIKTGRWERIVEEDKVRVEWFGAKGDSENDDTLFIQNSINSGYGIILLNKDYRITSPIYLKNNIEIIIVGRIKINKHGYRCFIINQKENIKIKGTGKIEGHGFFPEYKMASLPGGGEKHFCFKNGRNFPTGYDDKDSHLGKFGNGFIGNGGSGIFIYGGKNISIKGIEISGFNFSGICIGDPIKNNDPFHPISKNIIINCYISNIYDSGISVFAAENVVVGDLTVVKKIGHPEAKNSDSIIDPGYGITGRLTGPRGIPVSNLKISGKFSHCKRKGIDIHSGNQIEMFNFSVEDNYIAGIALGSTQHNVYDIEIHDGIIKNSGKQTMSSIERRGGLKVASRNVYIKRVLIENSGVTESLYISGENITVEDIKIKGGEIPERSFTVDHARNTLVKKLVVVSGAFKEKPVIWDGAKDLLNSNNIAGFFCFELLENWNLNIFDCSQR